MYIPITSYLGNFPSAYWKYSENQEYGYHENSNITSYGRMNSRLCIEYDTSCSTNLLGK